MKMLGREGICRVEEGERGLMIAWIDNSPDAMRRQEAVRKKERMDRGDELREQRLIKEQVERAMRDAEEAGRLGDDKPKELVREEGEKVKLAFGTKKEDPPAPKSATPETPAAEDGEPVKTEPAAAPPPPTDPPKISMKIEAPKKKNVFASMGKKDKKDKEKKNVLETKKRPISEAERIMKMELEQNGARGPGGFKRQRM